MSHDAKAKPCSPGQEDRVLKLSKETLMSTECRVVRGGPMTSAPCLFFKSQGFSPGQIGLSAL